MLNALLINICSNKCSSEMNKLVLVDDLFFVSRLSVAVLLLCTITCLPDASLALDRVRDHVSGNKDPPRQT